ncbi:MAG: recombinase [Betaproteobacteria bacterium]|nr:MAG: recombinase [Betaproteobacteria bacterium]
MGRVADLAGLLAAVGDDGTDVVQAIAALVDWVRPRDADDPAPAIERVEALTAALESDAPLRDAACRRVQAWLASLEQVSLYTEVGIFSTRGFFAELRVRLYERVLPAPPDRTRLKDCLTLVFSRRSDARWVMAVPDETWLRLLAALHFFAWQDRACVQRARDAVLEALERLSLWFAAEGIEPELMRVDPRIARHDSPFIAQQRELAAFLERYAAWVHDRSLAYHDDRHAQVLLAQCAEQVRQLRAVALKRGTSLRLTYLLERLEQTLERIERLLRLIDPADASARQRAAVALYKEMIAGLAERHSLSRLWRDNVQLLSRRVAESASRTGEHYVTQTVAEYFEMLGSAAGAGLVVALMALAKLYIVAFDLAPLPETLLVCLNYGLGFVLIHLLHFTVATKQPAMTAATIAAAIEESERGRANLDKLAALLIQVGRSQFIAVVGNVLVALPVALAFGLAWQHAFGTPLLGEEKSQALYHELRPLAGLALLHAAIAGVWLFVAGLIAGYFDNRCHYVDLPGRVRAHPRLERLLGEVARERIAAYLETNYGALAGNFFFGVLLGATAFVGLLVGLPLDIRHVAFSSSNLGYSAASLPPTWGDAATYFAYVVLIAAVNLWVSFGLALYVALQARRARIASTRRLLAAYFGRLRSRPLEFLFPPASGHEAKP